MNHVERHGRVTAVHMPCHIDSLESVSVAKLQLRVDRGVKGVHEYGRLREQGLDRLFGVLVVSEEDHEALRVRLGLTEKLAHGVLGENITIRGIENLSMLPSAAMLCFYSPTGRVPKVIIELTRPNRPHPQSGELARSLHPDLQTDAFAALAVGYCGVIGSVTKGGDLFEGDRVTLVTAIKHAASMSLSARL